MDAHLELLAGIEKELNAIGVNINQITRSFHNAETPNQKMINALKIEEQYRKVGDRVDKLLAIVSELAKKWLKSKKTIFERLGFKCAQNFEGLVHT